MYKRDIQSPLTDLNPGLASYLCAHDCIENKIKTNIYNEECYALGSRILFFYMNPQKPVKSMFVWRSACAQMKQYFRPGNEVKNLRNVGWFSLEYSALYLRRYNSLKPSLWELQGLFRGCTSIQFEEFRTACSPFSVFKANTCIPSCNSTRADSWEINRRIETDGESGSPPFRITIALFKNFTVLYAACVPKPQIYQNAIK